MEKLKLLLAALVLTGATAAWGQKAGLADKGWTKTTALPENLNNHFFAIYDSEQDLGMVLKTGAHQGGDFKTMWYTANVEPETNKDALWTIIKQGDDHLMVNANYPEYFLQTEWNAAWFYRTHDNGDGGPTWGNVVFAIPDGKYTIQNGHYPDSGYLGPWDNEIKNGAEVAMNKTGEQVGHFDIYAITRGQYFANVDAAKASPTTPVSADYLITNNELSLRIMGGWTMENTGTLSNDYIFGVIGNDGLSNKSKTWYFESWQASGNLSDRVMYQELTDLPKGAYMLTVLTDIAATGATLFGNDSSVELKDHKDGVAKLYLLVDGTLKFGVRLASYTANWVKFDKFSLTYFGDVSIEEAQFGSIVRTYQDAVAEAKAVDTSKKMGDTPKSNLESAISTYADKTFSSVADYQTAINALNAATATAVQSISSYECVASGAISTDVQGNWAATNGQACRVNSWSKEGETDGSNMLTLFVENWVSSGNHLNEGEFAYTLQGMNPGETYYLKAFIRIYNEESTATPSGAKFFANSGEANISETGTSSTIDDTKTCIYGVYYASGTVASDGTLKVGVKIPSSCNFNWISIKDVKILTEAPKLVNNITISESSAQLTYGDQLQLTAIVSPDNADDKSVSWTSSDNTVATVDANGVVTAVGMGSASITATAKDYSGTTGSASIEVVSGYSPAAYTDITASDFVADDYYILNVATGKFLGGANSWGTQASLTKHGIPFGMAKAGEGVYTLDSYTYNNATKHFFDGTYVDAASANINVESMGDGKYAMYTLDGETKKYVTAKAGTTVVDNSATDGSSEMAQWRFLSVADMLSNVSEDATFLIREANVSRNLRISNGNRAWTGDHTTELNNNFNDDQKRAYNPNYVSERYHAETNVWQTIAVPNGTYKVRVQGFYRPDNGSTDASYLYANNEQVALNTFVEGQGVNADMLDVSKAFLRNMYWNELTVTVTDNRLTVGIRTDDTNNWTIWDNFELYRPSSGSRSSALIAEEGFITADNGETYAALNNAAGTVSATTQQRLTVSTNDYGIATISTPKGLLFWDNQQNKGVWADGQKHVQKTFFYPYWAFEESGNGYRIRNIQSGLYLTVADGKLTLAEDASEWRFDDVASESDVLSLKEKAANAVPTLGFESGEYAPYNNVEALQTVAQIQNTNADGMPSLKVEKLKNAISSLSWTSNAGDVDAVYDGSFAMAPIQATSENVALKGWVAKSGNLRQTFKGNGEAGKACLGDDEVGLFVHPGTYEYGEAAGYTMPLKGGQLYVAKAKYCSWQNESNQDFGLTILKNGETIATKGYGQQKTACTETGAFKEVKLYFTPKEDGDYVLSVYVSGNTFMTGFSITKTEVDAITIDEDATEAPAASDYANVTLNRAFKAGWNAVCLPMSVPAFNDCVIVELAGEEGESNAVTLKFRKVDSFKANKPYLVYFPADVAAGKTFEGIAVTPGEVKVEGTTFDFMGTYTAADVVKEGDYVIAGGKLSKANQTITLKGTRTYFTPKTAGARLAGFTVDGETTGVGATLVKSEEVKSEQIFDLKGVRVSKPAKGIFIQNGKKVIKN